jgi:pimeloyl-ACP methyl ester carboxylesterase
MRRLFAGFALLLVLALIALPFARNRETAPLDDAARAQAPGRFIELGHGLVHVLDEGPKSGPTVVLVHGFSVPSYVWEPLPAQLVAAGYRVVRFDLYGRGWSARPDVVYDRDVFATQLGGVLDTLDAKQVHLVGLSMGGAIVGRFAAQHPERIRSFALVAPLTKSRDIAPLQIPVIGEWLNRVWLLPKLAASQMSDFVRPERHAGWSERFEPQMRYEGFGRAILSTLRHVMTQDSLGDFAAVGRSDIPSLLIWGRQDSVVPFEHSDAVRAAIPAIRFVAVDDAGHLPHKEQEAQVAAALIAFLANQRSDTGAPSPAP